MTKTDPRSIAFWCCTVYAMIALAAQLGQWMGFEL